MGEWLPAGAAGNSGADDELINLIRRNVIVYAGSSAGPCVLAPDPTGLQRVDNITAVGCGLPVIPGRPTVTPLCVLFQPA